MSEDLAASDPAAGAVAIDGSPQARAPMLAAVDDRRARKHGKAMLDALAALQVALLADAADPDALAGLAALAADCPRAADPALDAVLRAVALRAQVEIARRSL